MSLKICCESVVKNIVDVAFLSFFSFDKKNINLFIV